MICGFSLPSSILLPCKRRNVGDTATFFWIFDLILTVYNVRQMSFLSFSKWQIALSSSLLFASKCFNGIPYLCFFKVPTVVKFRVQSQFADSTLVCRRSLKIVLPLIDCCFSICWTRHFTYSIASFVKCSPSPTCGIWHHLMISREALNNVVFFGLYIQNATWCLIWYIICQLIDAQRVVDTFLNWDWITDKFVSWWQNDQSSRVQVFLRHCQSRDDFAKIKNNFSTW